MVRLMVERKGSVIIYYQETILRSSYKFFIFPQLPFPGTQSLIFNALKNLKDHQLPMLGELLRCPVLSHGPWISTLISMLPFLPWLGPSVPAVTYAGAQPSQLRISTPPTSPLPVSIWCSSVACTWDESTAHWHDCLPPYRC